MTDPQLARKEALVIVNPTSRKLPGRQKLEEADEWLRESGWVTEWVETAAPGGATQLAARAAAQGVPLVFVCGGDGTLSEAVNGLAGTETAVSVIPAGTVNLWARECGLLKHPADAVRMTVEGVRRRVDLGKAGDRYFLLMAGYGMDAAVVHSLSPRAKAKWGAAAYAVAAVRQALTYRGLQLKVQANGEDLSSHVTMLVAGNTRNYAGISKITLEAVVDDGLLDVCLYCARSRWDVFWLALLTFLHQHKRSKNVLYRRVRDLHLEWDKPPPVQLDGDAWPESPQEVKIARGALWVMVPRRLKSPLFSRRPGQG